MKPLCIHTRNLILKPLNSQGKATGWFQKERLANRFFDGGLLPLLNKEAVWQVGEVDQYLERGPGFVFLYHPALGPLWEVIGQKLRGGRLAHGAEVVLDVAEAQVRW